MKFPILSSELRINPRLILGGLKLILSSVGLNIYIFSAIFGFLGAFSTRPHLCLTLLPTERHQGTSFQSNG